MKKTTRKLQKMKPKRPSNSWEKHYVYKQEKRLKRQLKMMHKRKRKLG